MGDILVGIEDLLLQDEHVKEIIPAEAWGSPEIDYSVFKDGSSAMFYLGMMERFLSCGYVIDDFIDHENERKPWLHEMYARHGRVVYDYLTIENALKRGNFVHISNGFTPVIDFVEDNYEGPEKEHLNLLSLMLKKDNLPLGIYDAMPAHAKMGYVKRIKSRIYTLLNFLAQESAARKAS